MPMIAQDRYGFGGVVNLQQVPAQRRPVRCMARVPGQVFAHGEEMVIRQLAEDSFVQLYMLDSYLQPASVIPCHTVRIEHKRIAAGSAADQNAVQATLVNTPLGLAPGLHIAIAQDDHT